MMEATDFGNRKDCAERLYRPWIKRLIGGLHRRRRLAKKPDPALIDAEWEGGAYVRR